MRRRQGSERLSRRGFTLVELLVVIAIIAVLVSLTAAAVMRARLKAYEVQNRNNVQQLSSAVSAFVAKTGVDYIPSAIVLRNDGAYTTSATDVASLAYLKRLWPRLAFPITWCPNDPSGSLAPYTLEGDQCLVFFLGGVQVNGACFGFSTNATNPMQATPGTVFNPPYFDFPSNQLVNPLLAFPKASYTSPFLTFLDPYNSPYAYFSSRGNVGGLANAYSADCPALGVLPYHDPNTTKFYNPQGFQIISAGYAATILQSVPPPFAFDTSGLWVASSGNFGSPPAPASASNPLSGYHQLTNFSQFVMGAGNP
jgi:prepilin-type N-terminal cleavage/methylation domain-containing protein